MKKRLIPLPTQRKETRLSAADCRAILQEEADELNDARIIEIRDYLYRLAALAWEQCENEQEEKETVSLFKTPHKPFDYEKSDYLRAG